MRAQDLVQRLEGVSVDDVEADDQAESFLREMQESLRNDIESESIVGLGDVFYTTLTSELIGVAVQPEFRTAVIDLIQDLATDSGGYQELTGEMIEKVNKWDADEAEPTALGTAYCALLTYLLDVDYPNNPYQTLEWWRDIRTEQGLFFNENWSDTQLSSRYPSEYLGEAFLTFVVGDLLHDEVGIEELSKNDTVDFIEDEGLFESDYLSAEYYAVRILELAGEADKIERGELESFLNKHQDEVDYGYQEYLLEEKSDEQSGSSSRTKRDSVGPHIYATMQALILTDRFDLASGTELNQILTETLAEAQRTDGGYGFPVTIREYDPTYGPVTTPRETYYALIGQEIY